MGFEYLTAAIKCARVRGTMKLVLIVLADRADNKTGVCWPSVRRVAQDAGIAKSTAQAHLKAIEALAIMKVVARGNETKSNRYRLDLDAMRSASGTQEGTGSVPATGTGSVPECGIGVPSASTRPVPTAGTEPIMFESVREPATVNLSIQETNKEVSDPLASLAGQSRVAKEQDREEDPKTLAAEDRQQHDDARLLRIWEGRHVATLESIWEEHTGNALAEDEVTLAQVLVSDHGLDEVGGVLIDTFSCPALRKIAWTDFRVWARNYSLNKSKVLAWRRALGEEKADAQGDERAAALARHAEAGEQECFAPILAALEVPDNFRCPDCGYSTAGERTRWCVDCFDEMRGEGASVCELGLSLGDCPECRGMTPDGWEYCRKHGCAQCGKKAIFGRPVCEFCSSK
jgi:hypothetical protein